MPRPVRLGLVAALSIAAVTASALIVSEESTHTIERVIQTAAVLLVFGLAAAAGVLILDSARAPLGWLTVGLSTVGFGLFTVAIWSTAEFDSQDTGLWKAGYALLVASLAFGHVSLLARGRNDDRLVGRVKLGTQLAALVLATLAVIAIVESIDDETYFRWLGVAAILWILGTALIPLVRGLRRPA